MQHTFFVHFFAVVLHDYNVKLPETSWLHVLWRKSRACSCSFFSLPLIFTLVGASISYFLTAATKFSCCFSNRKNVSFVFYLSLCLSLLFSLSFAGLSPTFSFSLSPSSLYSKFVDMTINLSLILSRTRIQKKFRLYWLFSCLCFTRREWLCDFRQKNLKLPYLYVHWVIFTLVCLWWGRMVGRAGGCTVTSLPKFLGCTGYKIFLPMVLRCARESSVNIKAVNYALFLTNHIVDLLICC